ncbi:MAG TPA: NADH-quinone oxidoreductase subunit M, partial [Myxococcaceae bacterium]|nr:NADH-quinone oxidoreductase subunit M [Myxococcaceae bacterium]
MLSLLIFFPLVGVLAMYLLSKRVGRTVATVTSGVELALAAVVALRIDWSQGGVLQLEERVAWVPTLGASYHVAVDGLSVPLILLTALLTFLSLLYAGVEEERSPTFHAMFLVMETALIGLFSTQDLLLFYLFWEASLVPMYFIIGVWGHEERVKSALKFFLFTRLGGLALLLAILGLYLGVEPHTFDIPTLVRAQPHAGTSTAAALILLCFLIAFGIKLPVVPLHTWLPDAHTEAPTEGSVLMAGVLLKMGGYGLVRLALPTVGDMLAEWALVLAILAVVSGLYGTAVAMAQEDLKRLVAYSSVNHMAYVLLAVSVAAMLGPGSEARQAALTGAVYQLVAHGLATGALFFLVGMIARRAGTREISKLSGLWGAVPMLGTVLAVVMF